MCEVCGKFPCDVRCPNYVEPRHLERCAECYCELYAGDSAYLIGNKYYCEDCVRKIELEEEEDSGEF